MRYANNCIIIIGMSFDIESFCTPIYYRGTLAIASENWKYDHNESSSQHIIIELYIYSNAIISLIIIVLILHRGRTMCANNNIISTSALVRCHTAAPFLGHFFVYNNMMIFFLLLFHTAPSRYDVWQSDESTQQRQLRFKQLTICDFCRLTVCRC